MYTHSFTKKKYDRTVAYILADFPGGCPRLSFSNALETETGLCSFKALRHERLYVLRSSIFKSEYLQLLQEKKNISAYMV